MPATHWRLVLEAGDGSNSASQAALEELCRIYWQPLYTYLRKNGHRPHDAQDLVQGFLSRIISREDLENVSPEKGRFRTFLLASLRNFAIKQALREKALKRGGGKPALSVNTDDAERLCGPDLNAESPELAFDRHWCRTVLSLAFQRLREEQVARGRESQFEILAPYLSGANSGEYDDAGALLGMAPGTVAVTVHRLRARLQTLVRAEVAQTVADSKQAGEEIKHLMAVWQK